jgi:hypothetical protein
MVQDSKSLEKLLPYLNTGSSSGSSNGSNGSHNTDNGSFGNGSGEHAGGGGNGSGAVGSPPVIGRAMDTYCPEDVVFRHCILKPFLAV